MPINFPDSPSLNDTHTVNGRTWAWNGTYWKLSGSANRGISLQISDTAPSDPVSGDMWYESDTGRTFTYYDGFWVELGNSAAVESFISDNDNDTLIEVEASADNDTITFTTGATPRFTIGPDGHIVPGANETYDLGSASNRFRDLYLSGNSINLGGVEITSDGTNISLPNVDDISVQSLTVGGKNVTAYNGNRNIVYNGAMQVAQRGTSVTGLSGVSYNTADRWNTLVAGLGAWTQSVENDAPTGSGFAKSLKMLCTTADAAPAASDWCVIQQLFEGQDLQRIKKGTSAAEQLTLSFWVKSNVTGTYVACVLDNDNTRICSGTYTVSSSATWEFKTITFPADTTGALDNDNNASFRVQFALGGGSDWTSGTLNTTWASTVTANRLVGQVNVAAATNNYWQITGVQLETGPVATPFEFLPYGEELARCQRYFVALHNRSSSAVIYNSPDYWAIAQFELGVEMRSDPTVSNISTVQYTTTAGGASAVDLFLTAGSGSRQRVFFIARVNSRTTVGDSWNMYFDGAHVSAEL